mgnify:CR=1 FL=1
MTAKNDKELLACLGEVLEYPRQELPAKVQGASALAEGKPEVQAALSSFLLECESYTDDRLAEVYTRTFDVAPRCSPYLSIHLFGEESFHRARLMVGLRGALLAVGIDPAPELPDHFAIVLKAAPLLPADEWQELVDFVLRAGVHAMVESIENSQNPYSHLLHAVQMLVGAATAEDLQRLKAASQAGKNCTPPGSQKSCGGGC